MNIGLGDIYLISFFLT